MMKNPFHGPKLSIGSVLFLAWIVFTTIYVIFGMKDYFVEVVYQSGLKNGMQRGVQSIVAQEFDLAKKCEAIPLVLGEEKVTLVNVACDQTVVPTPE